MAQFVVPLQRYPLTLISPQRVPYLNHLNQRPEPAWLRTHLQLNRPRIVVSRDLVAQQPEIRRFRFKKNQKQKNKNPQKKHKTQTKPKQITDIPVRIADRNIRYT